MQASQDGSECDAARALNVIVEAGDARAILVQDPPRYANVSQISSNIVSKSQLTIRQAKVLKVNIRLRIQLLGRLHKRIHELIVLLPAHTLLPQTEVELVIQELLVVCPAVEHDGQAAVRVDAGAERGQGELGDGDEDAADALVADAKDLLSIWRS
jgi:hypothetical protein